ncbi:MAG TPA: class I SAM-dependent methyltransferase [Sulfurimonas sp.]|nr:class I SAM-dependent methyltransferase [Sulfurimonas sp.]
MSEFDPVKYKKMVKDHQDNDNPLGWFDSIYTDAKGHFENVFWADLEASPYLLKWLEANASTASTKAIAIGCGLGDDAEAMSNAGYEVTAFDISPEAIKLCKERYPKTKVNYLVEDLFNAPASWINNFDLVFECNTIQVLPGKYRIQARDSMVSFLKKDGHILVSCRSRLKGKQEDAIPLPLDKDEIDCFKDYALSEKSFLIYDDTQEPSVPHFFAVYQK